MPEKGVLKKMTVVFCLLLILLGCGQLQAGPESALKTPIGQQDKLQQDALATKAAELTQGAYHPPTMTLTEVIVLPGELTETPTATPLSLIPTDTPVPPTPLPTETPTPEIPTETPIPPTPTETPIPCDEVALELHVTIPNDTVVPAGEWFTKVWRLRNTGTCSWEPEYALVFAGGARLNGADVIRVGTTVYPDETIDITVNLEAPALPGTYTGNWMMRTEDGVTFGAGESGQETVDLRIRVMAEIDEDHPLDLTWNYQSARWFTPQGNLPVPSDTFDFKNGAIVYVAAPVLEGGYQDDEPALVLVPNDGEGGKITGHYPPIKIQNGDHLATVVGCLNNSPECETYVSIDYVVGDNSPVNLLRWKEIAEGDWTRVNIDLSSLAGKSVEFIFTVENSGSSKDDRVFFLAPQIRR